MSNTFGKIFTFTSFGESHGRAIGGIVDGCPSNIEIDEEFIQSELNRRRPGQSDISTPRKEDDKVEFLSGIFEGKTTGTPIAFVIWNTNQHSHDYEHLKDVYRPSHADFTYQQKYGIRDHRGGGRSSARETAGRVVAGAIAKLALRNVGVEIVAYTSQVGHIKMQQTAGEVDYSLIETNPVRCPEPDTADKMISYIKEMKEQGDSVGGIIACTVKNVPVGWGNPVFDKLSARLAQAMFSINAVHGFDYGEGFEGVGMKGSEINDAFIAGKGMPNTLTNYSGGIQGGISNGQDIDFRVLFKPVATISKPQRTVDVHNQEIELKAHGRHDPCVLPRAVPIVEAMTAIALMDFYLMDKG
ncbi:chorismate synthase [Paludibacter sp. 221]|uniref:chorismate synthase n=1 Tax=Paludibacter sp. 221 TaxID=2302939 RepID=UPI0013D7D488|nr:chorismate synthase [Paludibacter sp. 221]NDV46788.1 chorismate synthase [Paludibacter sp. 221]